MSRRYYSEEAEMRARRDQTVGALVMLMLGAGIGAVLALLFAPEPGDTTRDRLTDDMEHYYENGRDATSSTLDRLQREFRDFRDEVESRWKELT